LEADAAHLFQRLTAGAASQFRGGVASFRAGFASFVEADCSGRAGGAEAGQKRRDMTTRKSTAAKRASTTAKPKPAVQAKPAAVKPRPSTPRKVLADPTTLQPFQHKPEESTGGTATPKEELLQVIIETPKGCRNKYSFDPKQEIFLLKSALPAGMVFPYDFGFVPRTLGEDGDPLDVLVLMDEPAFTGCAVLARIIGVIEGNQFIKSKASRNDRLIAVAETTHIYSDLKRLSDVPEQSLREIEEFFVNYHDLQGKKFVVLARKGRKAARKLIEQGQKMARQQKRKGR
jgi:inorganic pyrophosphatase